MRGDRLSFGRWIALYVPLAAIFVVATVVVSACGGGGSSSTTGPSATTSATSSSTTGAAVPGTITATVQSIQGQNGKTLTVGVYDFDWTPGSPNTFVGLIYVPIAGDDFSSTVVVTGVGADGSPAETPATFQPGTYSVVFFVSAAGSAPEFFTEVRATVAGDISVSAPTWDSW